MKAQGLIFVFVCLLGFGFGFIYDVIRILEEPFGRLPFLLAVWDFIYWIFASAAVFYFLLGINYGNVRLYMVLGFMGGMICYYLTLSPSVMNVSLTVLRAVKRILMIILKPVYIIGNIIKLWLKNIANRVIIGIRQITNPLRGRFKRKTAKVKKAKKAKKRLKQKQKKKDL